MGHAKHGRVHSPPGGDPMPGGLQWVMQSMAECIQHLEEIQFRPDYSGSCKAWQSAFTTWRRPNIGRTIVGHAKHGRVHSTPGGDPMLGGLQWVMQSMAECIYHQEKIQCRADYSESCKAWQSAFTTWRRSNAGQTTVGHAKHGRVHSPPGGDPMLGGL